MVVWSAFFVLGPILLKQRFQVPRNRASSEHRPRTADLFSLEGAMTATTLGFRGYSSGVILANIGKLALLTNCRIVPSFA